VSVLEDDETAIDAVVLVAVDILIGVVELVTEGAVGEDDVVDGLSRG
jgi:hypothetical protein